ncbi:MAG: AAA family ATPase [Candidatus Micrarchaeota archaeon]
MNLFEETNGESVFKNELALNSDFEPKELPGRENELKEMALILSPVLQAKKTRTLFLHGPPGTGKTSSINYLLKELSEHSSKIKCLKVNCWNNYTKAAVLSELAQQVGAGMPRRGLANDEIFNRLIEIITKSKENTVIFLDEVDRLSFKKEENVLYELARSQEIKAIILATNYSEFLTSLDNRIRSSLNPESTSFNKYSPAQLKNILRERSALAFKKNACSEEAIALSAANAAKNNGDARLAISLLLQAGRNADARQSKKVEDEDVRKAIEKNENPSKEKKLVNLKETEQKIISLLKEKGEATAGEVYENISLGERAGRNYLQILEAKGLIERITTTKGRGRTTVLKLK